MGRHEGVIRFTIGQRRGLGVAAGDPLYVVKLDAPGRRVIVGPREALLTSRLTLGEHNWLGDGDLLSACKEELGALARVRSTRAPVRGALGLWNNQPAFFFEQPEEGVAPGQACVLYSLPDGRRVLGGGFITSTQPADPRLEGA